MRKGIDVQTILSLSEVNKLEWVSEFIDLFMIKFNSKIENHLKINITDDFNYELYSSDIQSRLFISDINKAITYKSYWDSYRENLFGINCIYLIPNFDINIKSIKLSRFSLYELKSKLLDIHVNLIKEVNVSSLLYCDYYSDVNPDYQLYLNKGYKYASESIMNLLNIKAPVNNDCKGAWLIL